MKARFYSEQFSLSFDQAKKMAKLTQDFAKVNERTEADIADYAQKLYGVNPNEIVEAIAFAQVGNNEKLNAVIKESALNFGTTSENMKDIVKYLHKEALSEHGIEL